MAGGAMRKLGEYLGLVEQSPVDEYDDYDDAQGGDTAFMEPVPAHHAAPAQYAPVRATAPQPVAQHPAPVAHLGERRRPTVVAQAQPVELSRIVTMHPTVFNEVKPVGEHYREGVPVIINITEMSEAEARRVVDFASGLTFATFGTIERITSGVFLLSPANVSVSAEEKQRLASGGFFNQS